MFLWFDESVLCRDGSGGLVSAVSLFDSAIECLLDSGICVFPCSSSCRSVIFGVIWCGTYLRYGRADQISTRAKSTCPRHATHAHAHASREIDVLFRSGLAILRSCLSGTRKRDASADHCSNLGSLNLDVGELKRKLTKVSSTNQPQSELSRSRG